MDNCVFCAFDDSYKIEESGYSFAAYFDSAIRKGHIVVALKEHVTSLSAMSGEQASDIMALAARVAKKAESLVGNEKYYIVSIADQTPHYHIHLLPKMRGDAPLGPHIMGDAGWKGEVGEKVEDEELREFISVYRKL